MTTISDPVLDHSYSASGGVAAFIDCWIFVFMAGFILAIVLIGFVPDSFGMVARMEAGAAPPIPPILHVHAVLMGAWILLLLAQATLMATGRRGLHMQLGLIALILAPAIVIVGFMLVPVRHAQLYGMIAAAPADVAAYLNAEVVPFVTNLLLAQIRVGIVFPLLVGLALYVRKTDFETHKRLMILATIAPLPAAIDRIHFLPSSSPDSPLTMDLYALLVIAPLFVWDLYRRGGKVQRAYIVWLAVMLPTAIAQNLLWSTPWWLETGPKLVGAAS
ncbi:hypothetical protein [Hyphococcus sp.]|uniref:hypothetical protein n=1 Tax=Hyphococcus sp. TaxID=2038636 RepID=UPI003D0CFCF9